MRRFLGQTGHSDCSSFATDSHGMLGMLIAQCDACGRTYRGKPSMAGQPIRCKCGNITRFKTQVLDRSKSDVAAKSGNGGQVALAVPRPNEPQASNAVSARSLLSWIQGAGTIPGVLYCFGGLILLVLGSWILADVATRIRIGIMLVGLLILSGGIVAATGGFRRGQLWPEPFGNRPYQIVTAMALHVLAVLGVVGIVYVLFA